MLWLNSSTRPEAIPSSARRAPRSMCSSRSHTQFAASAPVTKKADRTPEIDAPDDLLPVPGATTGAAIAGPVTGPWLGPGPHIVQLVRFGPKAAEARSEERRVGKECR